jgi:FkbM family methyltransferase
VAEPTEPRSRSGVFYLRDLALEGAYRSLEAMGMRFAFRPRSDAPYEALLERFYRRLPLEGAVVVDVGAHFGRHAIPLARCVGPLGVVHAFEPLPFARKVFADRAEFEKVNNIVVYPFAVGDENRQSSFVVAEGRLEESGLKPRGMFNPGRKIRQREITVTLVRLDDALAPNLKVRFLKMDVEGGELDALRGATALLDRCRPIVAFECGEAGYRGYHDTPEALFEIFSTRGYAVHAITGPRMRDAKEFSQATHDQEFWDYIAFPPGDEEFARFLEPLSSLP